ncbi:hypothetical protein B296_00045749 [Ensete ventricosum]|uniref:Uncharacterized protein n=1 Tax=Ensete ventricosum TaxID=4639 RepID=A0A426XXE1_ENSVE|nr:hypothetical protein B296_00045749 [Ensete ventricosum]
MGRTYLAWCQRKGSFEAHASYLRDAFDGVTKVIQLAEAKLGLGYLSTGQEDAKAGVTQEWVDEGELARESKMTEALRGVGRGHTWRSRGLSSSHKNLYAMEMSPGGGMVQRIMVE